LDPSDPRQRGIRTVSFSFSPATYDARVRYVRSLEEFVAELRAADAAGQELWVNIGNPWSAQTDQKEMFELFADPEFFDPPIRLPGWNSTMDRMVARYRPGSLGQMAESD
ncbi:MAG: hypothetical protein N2322_07200, partial [Terrimicrobiaceae bacterium]|nr:hypothetical protein [Terrimicrobiaceae bacterium]